MAGRFSINQQSCEECGSECNKSNDAQTALRYTLKRNLCSSCAREKCADVIVDTSPSSSPTASIGRCPEHRHREIILYCAKCAKPICDVCTHLTHSGHPYQDLNKAIKDRRTTARNQHAKLTEKEKELALNRREIGQCEDAVNERFKSLRFAVLVRVEDNSRTLEEERCISERKIRQRAKDEKLKVDRWEDNRLREIKEDREKKSMELQQRQCELLQTLDEVKLKLLGQLEEIREGLESADKIISDARAFAERTLTQGFGDLLQTNVDATSNSRVEECLNMELDDDTIRMVTDIAKSVKFEPASSDLEGQCLLGRFVTTAPAWCKMHTIQVGLPNFRLLNATKNSNHVTFTGENDDNCFGLYMMNVEDGSTNLITSDAHCVNNASSINPDLMAVSRKERNAIEIWNTKLQKLKKHIKIPRNWSHTCLTVDQDGLVIARDHTNTHGKLNVYRPETGDKVRSIPYSGTIFSLHSLSTGDIVIQSAATEIVIIKQVGEVRTKITELAWQWVRCAVANDDTIIVAYGRVDEPSTMFVDSYSPNGEFVEHVMRNRCSPSLSHIAVVVTSSGRIVVQNGGDIVVYDRLIPLVPVTTTSNRPPNIVIPRSPNSSPQSSPPRTPTRRTIFMCIPT